MLTAILDRGANPVLEEMIHFTAERHKLMAHNIANIDTPGYRPVDLDTDTFQATLGRAIDERRKNNNGTQGPLMPRDDVQSDFRPNGTTVYSPQDVTANIMMHDGNNRSIENIMKDVAENTLAHNAAIAMLRKNFATLNVAISERV